MGYYVNPPNQDKLSWLKEHGEPIQVWGAKITETHLPVCCVCNGMFWAAAVCYSENELASFSDNSDRRLKMWYLVPRTKLAEIGAYPLK